MHQIPKDWKDHQLPTYDPNLGMAFYLLSFPYLLGASLINEGVLIQLAQKFCSEEAQKDVENNLLCPFQTIWQEHNHKSFKDTKHQGQSLKIFSFNLEKPLQVGYLSLLDFIDYFGSHQLGGFIFSFFLLAYASLCIHAVYSRLALTFLGFLYNDLYQTKKKKKIHTNKKVDTSFFSPL